MTVAAADVQHRADFRRAVTRQLRTDALIRRHIVATAGEGFDDGERGSIDPSVVGAGDVVANRYSLQGRRLPGATQNSRDGI